VDTDNLSDFESGAVDVGALTSVLAQRLTDLVPDALLVTVHTSDVWITSERGNSVVCQVARLVSNGGSVAERVCAAVERALECASEMIRQETVEPWSVREGDAHAELVGDVVRLWYGPATAPSLELPAIPLDELHIRPPLEQN
jgi:hypothetical protein